MSTRTATRDTGSVSERDVRVGDRIVVESESVGKPARVGEILEVTTSAVGPSFEVRWEDGRRTSIRPAAGSARFERRA